MNKIPPLSPLLRTILILFLGNSVVTTAETGEQVVTKWLETNSGVRTMRVEFTQTRRMPALKNPISQKGVLCIDRPSDRFRWQIGAPPVTIVVRKGQELTIVRPRQKKFERRPVKQGASEFSALAQGFPRTFDEFKKNYRLLELQSHKQVTRIVTQPLGRAARGVATFTFVVGSTDYRLKSMQLSFRDGTTKIIVFDKVSANLQLAPSLFEPDISGYKPTKF